MKAPLTTLIAIICGLIVFSAYFRPFAPLQNVSHLIINWAVTLSGVAMLVAIISLLSAHWQKIRQKRSSDRYSILVIFGFSLVFLIGLVFGGPGNEDYQKVVTHIIFPVEAGLMGISHRSDCCRFSFISGQSGLDDHRIWNINYSFFASQQWSVHYRCGYSIDQECSGCITASA